MFKKQASFKPSAAIRNSERKALIVEVKQLFSSAFNDKSVEDVKAIIDLILPSAGIEATTFTSTKGHRGTLYTHADVAIFVKYEDKVVPTLHTLWKYPNLTTSALTGSQVLTNLQAGSDLMIKGMFEYSPSVKKNDVVAILVSDKSHYVAVGIAAVDFDSVKRDEGGKGILLVSCLGDTITPVSSYPEEENIVEPIADMTEKLELSEHDTQELATEETAGQEWPELTTAEIDEAFVQALLYGLHLLSSQSKDEVLPMPASTLIDSHVLPYLPSHHPDITLKKTSWKKANKFLSKQKVLRTKETKGQLNITGIEWTSPQLTGFAPYRLPTAPALASASELLDSTSKHNREEPNVLVIEELYSLPSKFTPLLPDASNQANTHYTRQELSDVLDAYCAQESLVSSTNKKMISLNPHLFHLLLPTTSPAKKEVSKDVLLRALVRESNVHHRINGGKLKRGSASDLQIVMESRQGRKSVTRVLHLERYFEALSIERIVDELKRKCAVSVSVGEVKGTKPGSSVELTVQGKKSVEAQEVLEKWGVKKNMIKVEDKTK